MNLVHLCNLYCTDMKFVFNLVATQKLNTFNIVGALLSTHDNMSDYFLKYHH